MSQGAFGPIMQLGFVVDDIELAAKTWSEQKGVGPFFVDQHVKHQSFVFRGEETPVDLTLAFSYCGPIQIELIKQHNDVPSIYTERKNALGVSAGLIHTANFTDDLAGQVSAMQARGNRVIQHALDEAGKVESIYLEPSTAVGRGQGPQHPDAFIEYIQVTDDIKGLLEMIQAACADWDGKDAIQYVS